MQINIDIRCHGCNEMIPFTASHKGAHNASSLSHDLTINLRAVGCPRCSVVLCDYHIDSLGWDDCTEGFEGCQIELMRLKMDHRSGLGKED